MNTMNIPLPEQLHDYKRLIDNTVGYVAEASGYKDDTNYLPFGMYALIGYADANGNGGMHLIAEGKSGDGKTQFARALGNVPGLSHARVQGTPDLTASDIAGSEVYDKDMNKLVPVASFITDKNFIHADEFNRMSPKAQTAFLEAMAEGQMTIGASGRTTKLQPIFNVFATQNPIHQEGTMPVAAATLDRFHIWLPFEDGPVDNVLDSIMETVPPQPSATHNRYESADKLNKDSILEVRNVLHKVGFMPDTALLIKDVTTKFFDEERTRDMMGSAAQVSRMRSAQAMARLARIHAGLNGQTMVTPDHLADVTPYVLGKYKIVSETGTPMDKYNETVKFLGSLLPKDHRN